MTITAELFDGTKLEFPDGTDPTVISRVAKDQTARIKAASAPQDQGAGQIVTDPATGAPVMQQPPRADAPASPAAPKAMSGRVGRSIYENVIGSGEIDTPGEYLGDMIRSAGAGAARGVASLAGLPGTVSDLMDVGAKKAGLLREDAPGSVLSGSSLTRGLGSVTGGATEYRSPTIGGKIAGTVGEFLPGAMVPGATAKNLLTYGVLPGAASEVAGQMTEGTAAEPWARAGAALVAPVAGIAATNLAKRAISPLGGADPERLKLAKVLDDFGVPVTAGQRTGSDIMRKIEGAALPGSAADDQLEAFTSAALKTVGTNAKRATPEVLDATAKRIGDVFDDVVRGVDVVPDAAAVTKFSQALETYRELTASSNVLPVFKNIHKELVRTLRGGTPIPASNIKAWRSKLSSLTTSADQATRQAAIEALDVLDDTMAQSLNQLGRADDVARLVEARGQWRNFIAIRTAASRAGEERALGLLSPSALRNEIASQGRAAIATGKRGDIGALARAGEAVIKPLPTVSAGGVRNVPGMSQIMGGGLGAAAGGAFGAAPMGAIAGMMAPYIGRQLAVTQPMQNYLANQLAGAGGKLITPRLMASMAGLLPGALSIRDERGFK